MSIRQRISGIWLMSMSLLALFAFTCYFVAQMWLSILRTAYLTLVILQIAALTIYLWGPEKLKHRWQKILYRLFYASSFFVIPAFLFIFTGLVSQYHVRIPDSIPAGSMQAEAILPVENRTTVYDTGTVYIIFPEYSGVHLVCETARPNQTNPSPGAAAQHSSTISASASPMGTLTETTRWTASSMKARITRTASRPLLLRTAVFPSNSTIHPGQSDKPQKQAEADSCSSG